MPITISPVCLKCGSVKKSKKMSCCARGGSWFGKCGDSGEHTWSQGFEACRASSKVVMGQQLRTAPAAFDSFASKPANQTAEALITPIIETVNTPVDLSMTLSKDTKTDLASLAFPSYDLGTENFGSKNPPTTTLDHPSLSTTSADIAMDIPSRMPASTSSRADNFGFLRDITVHAIVFIIIFL